MTQIRILIFKSILISLAFINAEVIDPCEYNDHFTDPKYTCCTKNRYKSPEIYTNIGWINKCIELNAISPHIVQSLWSFYRCLLGQAIGEGKEITFESIREVLGKELPAQVKSDIVLVMDKLKTNFSNYDPFAGRSDLESYRTIAIAWNAYYVAESWACSTERNMNTTLELIGSDENSCKSWILQSFKRGDCCNNIPIPLELFPDTYLGIDQLELKNFTANTFMTLTGTYKTQNATLISRSNINSVCRRAALFIKQGFITQDKVKSWLTTPASTTYDDTIRSIIPKYLSPLRDDITKFVKRELEMDEDIRILSNFSIDGRDFSFVNEWVDDKKLDLNATRLLLWNCHAMKVAVTSYKKFDFSGKC